MRIKVLKNFKVGKNHLGQAVFADRDFKRDAVIVKFEGPIVHSGYVPQNLFGERDRYFQVGEFFYMGPSGEIDDLINHSCEPNAGLKFTDFGIILVAIRNIKKGEEITWDYSTTLYNNRWTMDCLCSSNNCRKKIREFLHLPEEIQKKYLDLGIVPQYIRCEVDKGLRS